MKGELNIKIILTKIWKSPNWNYCALLWNIQCNSDIAPPPLRTQKSMKKNPCKGEKRTNYMQLSWSLLMLVTQHVSGIIMPIIRSTRRNDKPHTVFCTGRREWTWGDEMDPVCTWWLWSYNHGFYLIYSSPLCTTSAEHRMRFASFPVLLMMGIIMPETCRVTNINKLQLNCV
jgi:hypothetical protein